jgi:hypothetical protein
MHCAADTDQHADVCTPLYDADLVVATIDEVERNLVLELQKAALSGLMAIEAQVLAVRQQGVLLPLDVAPLRVRSFASCATFPHVHHRQADTLGLDFPRANRGYLPEVQVCR